MFSFYLSFKVTIFQDNILQFTETVCPEQVRVVVFVGLFVLPGGMEGDVDAIAADIKDRGDVGLE